MFTDKPMNRAVYHAVTLTQADYAALLSMTGDLFQNIEPFRWYEAGRNALLAYFAPMLLQTGIGKMRELPQFERAA